MTSNSTDTDTAEPVAAPAPRSDTRAPAANLRLALPKGRTQTGVLALLTDARIEVTAGDRGYRPSISLPGYTAKILKPQSIAPMIAAGTRDLGFTGADWVAEQFGPNPESAGIVEVMDTGLDTVRLVAAAPPEILTGGELDRGRRVRIASEFEQLTRGWIERRGLDAVFVRSFGATEVLPPEDADCIVDLVSTGATLRANGLVVFDEVLRSSTRLFASAAALDDPAKRDGIESLVMVLRSVLDARQRVMLELNVDRSRLDAIVAELPCMRQPTIAQLADGNGFAVRAAVPRAALPTLIPALKARGGTDLVVTALSQIVA